MNKKTYIFLVLFSLSGCLFGMDQRPDGQPQQPNQQPQQGVQNQNPQQQPPAKKKKKKKKTNFLISDFANGYRPGGYQLSVKGVMAQYLMGYLMDEKRPSSLPNLLEEKSWDADVITGIFKEVSTYCILSAGMTGSVEAMEGVAKESIKTILDSIVSGISKAWNKGWNFLFHNNALPITEPFLDCLSNRIDSMMRGLQDAAHQSSVDGDLGKGLLRMQQFKAVSDDYEGAVEEDNVAQEGGECWEKDRYWEEISGLYLMQILQIVLDIRFRQKYYGKNDPIVISANNLILALAGKIKIDEVNKSVTQGGIFGHISNARNLADLASPDVARSIELLYQNIKASLKELSILIRVKAVESQTKGISSGGFSNYEYNYL